jgi:hypothetical protein
MLVPGDRWLLVTTLSGSVRYYDLDPPTITASTLVPIPFEVDGRADMNISIVTCCSSAQHSTAQQPPIFAYVADFV